MRRILIGGGARSGKSSFALERALSLGDRRVFVATSRALDGEMAERIARHRRDRGASFATVEEPIALPDVLEGLERGSEPPDVAVIDCLTMWLANLLLRGDGEDDIRAQVLRLARLLEDPPCHLVLVTNEVGFGIVPDNALGRAFRDLVGAAHQVIAPRCDEIHLATLGMILRLRPEPIGLVART